MVSRRRELKLCLALSGLFGILVGSSQGQIPESQVSKSALIAEAQQRIRAMEYEEAFELLEEALKRSRAAGNLRQEVEARLAMGSALADAGAWPRSVVWIEDTLPLIEELRRSLTDAAEGPALDAREAWLRRKLALAHSVLGNRSRARRELAVAADLLRQLDDQLGLAGAEAQLSLVEVHAGRYAEAVRAGGRALELLPDQQNDPEQTALALKALSAISYGHHQRQHLEEALTAYDRILELAWRINDQRQINFAYCNRAEVLWRLGDSKPVEEDLRRAIAGWEQARGHIPGTADQRSDFLAVQVAAYDRLIRFLAETSRGVEGFEIVERFHARSFLEMLDHPTLRSLGSRLPAQWRRRQEIVGELGQAHLRLATEGDSSGRSENDERHLLNRLEGELQAVETRILWHHRDPTETPAPPTLETVQTGLEPGEALIAYWLSEDRILVWVVLDGEIHFVQVPVTRHDLEQRVRRYLEPLRASRRAEDMALQGREAEHIALGQELYTWLVGAFPPAALAARRWIIVPDGVLHYLPFESLVMSCDAEAKEEAIHGLYGACQYLGLEKPLAYSPSAGTLLSLRRRQRTRPTLETRDLLAFAPPFTNNIEADNTRTDKPEAAELRSLLRGRAPLVHARDEVRLIANHFNQTYVRVDHQASESRLKSEASQYRLLHLATHGLIHDDHPMSSGVLLVSDGDEDGLLQAHEVLDLELTADIVTLSACRTGRGKTRPGAGVIGLSRAFLTAGASSVVVSLWDVDDRSTPRLMEAFYQQIAAGTSPPEAMLEARRHLFSQTTEAKLVFRTRPLAYAHPRFWASFVVIGTP